MRVYIGRWDLLPESWEGYNGLSEKTEEEIAAETVRQAEVCGWDLYIGDETLEQFEETFNLDCNNEFTTEDYWIKIF